MGAQEELTWAASAGTGLCLQSAEPQELGWKGLAWPGGLTTCWGGPRTGLRGLGGARGLQEQLWPGPHLSGGTEPGTLSAWGAGWGDWITACRERRPLGRPVLGELSRSWV